MTHHTDAELLRDIEEHMRKMWDARLLPAVCWPTELAQRLTKAARRAPAAPVPQGVVEPIETVKYWRDAYANPQGDEHFMGHGMVVKIFDDYLGMLAAAPQPPDGLKRENPATKPEAAPVQLPEPSAWISACQTIGGGVDWKLSWSKPGAGVRHRLSGEEFEHPLYTEQQVRELLAAHGIQERST